MTSLTPPQIGRKVYGVEPILEFLAIASGFSAILVLLADIPKIGILPASPRFLLILISLFLFTLHRRKLLVTGIKTIPVPVAVFMVMLLFVGVYQGGVRKIVSSVEGPATFILIFLLVTARGASGGVRFTRMLGVFYIVSGIWMVVSMYISQPFASIREVIYAGHLERFSDGYIAMVTPTGLTFNHFTMGYQLSVGFVLACFLYIAEKSYWKRIWMFGVVTGSVAIIFSAQRSAMLASICVLGLFLVWQRRFKTLFLLIMLAAGAALVIERGLIAGTAGTDTLGAKMQQKDDYSTRLRWQIAAVRIVAENPLGNISSNLNWEEEALQKDADFEYYDGAVKFIHNAYLVDMFNYGWAAVILIVFTLRFVYKKLVYSLTRPLFMAHPHSPWAAACIAALCSVMIQALFHNAGLFALEASTWVIFSTACAWRWLIFHESQRSK